MASSGTSEKPLGGVRTRKIKSIYCPHFLRVCALSVLFFQLTPVSTVVNDVLILVSNVRILSHQCQYSVVLHSIDGASFLRWSDIICSKGANAVDFSCIEKFVLCIASLI